MEREVIVPPGLRDSGMEVPYTPEQLEPTLTRLRAAVADLDGPAGTERTRLAAAWTRIAELRLPRKAVPVSVLDEVERLVAAWDGYGQGGITRHANAISEHQLRVEKQRVEWMLSRTEEAAAIGFVVPLIPTE
jgi:hypothetical protein